MKGCLSVPFNSAVSRILGKSFRSVALMAAVLLILISPKELSAQDDAQNDIPILVPHKPIAPKVNTTAFANEPKELRSMVGGPWMLDPSMKSTLYLRNSMETESVAATPVLYLSNGKKIILPSVNIKPASTATVSIGDALLEQGIAPYADLKGYAEISYVSSFDPLCATVVSVDTVHSVIFTYSFRPTAPAAITLKALGRPMPDRNANVDQKIDGLWWKQKASVTAFVSLSNTTNNELHAQLDVIGGTGQQLTRHEVSMSPHATEIIDLREVASVPASAGGIEISYNATPEAVLISGGLQDTTTGYSATMAFRPSSMLEKQAAEHTVTLTELGLMNGMQDPMMLFPGGTLFTPFSVVRNVSAKPASLVPELFWMERGSAQRKRLSTVTLAPSQSHVLDMPSLLKQAGMEGFNGVFNLTFRTTVPDNALLLASGSVDQTGTYVFQVLPHEVRESMAKTISYWSTANGDDTMVTVWNPADEVEDLLFTIRYEGGSYVLPLHLEARATRLFNVSSLIKDQLPDIYGHVIPSTVTSGSARITGTHADNERILVDIDAGSYNVRKATCWYYCISCDGALNALIGEPVNFAYQRSYQLSFLVEQTGGSTYDYSYSASWTSANPNIATISNTYSSGVSEPGLASGVNRGSFSASAYVSGIPIQNGDYCAYNAYCPDDGTVYGSGGGNVTDQTPIVLGLDPDEWISGQTTTVTVSGQYFGTNAPTLMFNPSSGISYTLASYNDSQIVANITVAPGTPTENVSVSVKNNGYGGVGFFGGGGTVPAVSTPVLALITAPASSPTITVVGWIDPSAPDLSSSNMATLAAAANQTLVTNLNNSCASEIWDWSVEQVAKDIYTTADRNYANTFLILKTTNTDPGPSITPIATYNGGNYRLIHSWGHDPLQSFYKIGSTPSPCSGVISFLGSFILGGGQNGPAMGKSGTSATGKVYQVGQGRVGTIGQRGSVTINNGRTVPWVYEVIEFDASGNPTYSDRATFPTYSVYKNGVRIAVYPQSSAISFVNNYDQTNVNAWQPVP